MSVYILYTKQVVQNKGPNWHKLQFIVWHPVSHIDNFKSSILFVRNKLCANNFAITKSCVSLMKIMIVKLHTRFGVEINILAFDLLYRTFTHTWLGIQFNLLKNLFLTNHQMEDYEVLSQHWVIKCNDYISLCPCMSLFNLLVTNKLFQVVKC